MHIQPLRRIACALLLAGVATIVNASDDLPLFPVELQMWEPDAVDVTTDFESVDEYKYYAAKQVVLNNPAHTFSGKLPPMLPAIVVLRITVDPAGRIRDMWVQRKPEHDDGQAEIAMASMYRAGLLPRPYNLAPYPLRTLEYSETFLFNDRNQFQLRSLAPVQTYWNQENSFNSIP